MIELDIRPILVSNFIKRIGTPGKQAYTGRTADRSDLHAAQKKLQDSEAELPAINDELLRFDRAAVGRELDTLQLKRQVDDLNSNLGRFPPYAVEFDTAVPIRPAVNSSGREA